MTNKIDEVYAAGGMFEGDGWTVKNIRYEPFQPPRAPVLTVGLAVAAQQLIESPARNPRDFRRAAINSPCG
jgi:hypothetical protein